MPAHYTAAELAEIMKRPSKVQPIQLDLFAMQERQRITERTCESGGHHWLVRECAAHAEYIQID